MTKAHRSWMHFCTYAARGFLPIGVNVSVCCVSLNVSPAMHGRLVRAVSQLMSGVSRPDTSVHPADHSRSSQILLGVHVVLNAILAKC